MQYIPETYDAQRKTITIRFSFDHMTIDRILLP